MIDAETVMAALGGGAAWAGVAKVLDVVRRARTEAQQATLQASELERQGVQAVIRELRTEVDRQRLELDAMRAAVVQCHADRADLISQVDRVRLDLARLTQDHSRWSLVEPESKLPTIYTDESGVVQDFTAAAVALFGWTRDEALGQDVAAFLVAPAYRQAHLDALRRLREERVAPDTGRVRQGEALTRDGRTIVVHVRLRAMLRLGSWLIAAEVWPVAGAEEPRRSHTPETGLPA